MEIASLTRSRMTRRAALAMAGGTAAGVTLARHGVAIAAPATPEALDHQVYFGWVLGSTVITAVAIDASASDAAGDRVIKAYVCDGFGAPDGVALWFKGTVTPGEPLTVTAPGGTELLTIDAMTSDLAMGMFTGKDGVIYRFASYIATSGAGIYDVTIDYQLRFSGTSTDGAILAAQADEKGSVIGTITTTDGAVIHFSVRVLSLMPEEELIAQGLSTHSREFAYQSNNPDTYVAVIAPGGSFWLGRSGDVRVGKPGNNIIDTAVLQ